MAQYSQVIERYENGVDALENAVKGVPEGMVDHAPAPGKWSIRQIVAHITDSELVGAARFRWIAAEPGAALKAYDQEAWAAKFGYEKQDLADMLQLFRALRKTTAAMLRTLSDETWSNTAVHEERGEVSLLKLVAHNSEHVEQHVRQITAIRAGSEASAA